MPGLRLFTSNRLETLAEQLTEVLKKPLPSPLDPEVIVIQSRGMERWVSMQLAQRLGTCANFRFPFPNHFAHEIFRKLLSALPEKSPYDRNFLTWRIMKRLPSCISIPGFELLRGYLQDSMGHLKRFQLAERIANVFDQYLLFRPEMIFKWEKGEEDHWQAMLWRKIVKECGNQHRATLGKQLAGALNAPASTMITGLPLRVSVFGISALPRFHMEILSGIARFTQVNLFVMYPCREYWGDIVSDWEMTKKTVRAGKEDLTPEDLHLEKGNSLLASMGTLGKEFFDLVNEFSLEESSHFVNPGRTSLLSHIQSDILNLRDAQCESGEKRRVMANDVSVQIHACHGSMREMEVLHDQLLHMFEQDPELLPRDILVMTPDIETYAPYIQAVFDTNSDEEKRIPFSIADRSIRRESLVADAFLAILELERSRFGANRVLAILESPAVQGRFSLIDSDVELIRRWVKDTQIRWGIDGKSRTELGLPAFPENTWRIGLDRLLLGYAMPGRDEKIFHGILPYDFVEGADTSILGNFCDFAERLFYHVSSLKALHTTEEWAALLTSILDGLFLPDAHSEREMQVVRQKLSDLANIKDLAGFDEPVDINVIRWHLAQSLEQEGFGFGFITGGVTFCAMLPMRSIPFKVICLVGMDNDAYPRPSTPLGFDLIAKHPRSGDRSRRSDDRYLFLEAMLSARNSFYISYIGQSIQDNSMIPPSVLVSELLDYIDQGFEMPGKKILDALITQHKLQAFSPEYFKGNQKLFSYSGENLRASRAMLTAQQAPAPFIAGELSDPDETWKTVAIGDLCNFFGNPARFIVEKRLGIYLDERDALLEEREVFELGGLDKYFLEQHLLKKKLDGERLEIQLAPARASGQLPHGTVGECIFETLRQGIELFAKEIQPYTQGRKSTRVTVHLQLCGFRLVGQLEMLYPDRLLQYRYARITPKDRLRLWIYHLILNSIGNNNYPQISMLAGLDPFNRREPVWVAWEFPPVKNSKEILGKLLEKYWFGLKRPLHFFPKSSWDYSSLLLEKNKPQGEALQTARNTWMGNEYARGECEDAYYQLCFRNVDPLDSEFEKSSTAVFKPIIEYEKKI